MSGDSGRQQFDAFLDEMIGGRHDEAGARLASDVVWHLPPFAKLPPLVGHEAVMDFMRKAPAAFYRPETMRLEKHALTWDDPFASCLATLRATTRHGRPYENRYVFFARLHHGRLAEVWEMMDTAVFQALTRAPDEPGGGTR